MTDYWLYISHNLNRKVENIFFLQKRERKKQSTKTKKNKKWHLISKRRSLKCSRVLHLIKKERPKKMSVQSFYMQKTAFNVHLVHAYLYIIAFSFGSLRIRRPWFVLHGIPLACSKKERPMCYLSLVSCFHAKLQFLFVQSSIFTVCQKWKVRKLWILTKKECSFSLPFTKQK